jgi:DNA-binding transcriptional regulator YiaG
MTKGKSQIEWDADTIKALRQHMGLTQKEMSEELGTRQQTISEWETGMYKPRGATRTLLTIVAERTGFVYRVEAEKERDSKEIGDSD